MEMTFPPPDFQLLVLFVLSTPLTDDPSSEIKLEYKSRPKKTVLGKPLIPSPDPVAFEDWALVCNCCLDAPERITQAHLRQR